VKIAPFIEAVEKQKLNVEGIVVLRHGREALEPELVRHRWAPETRRNVRSIAKSFTSIAIGMAIDEGILKLSDKLTQFFSIDTQLRPLQKSRWEAVTLENLLTMTLGHDKLSRPKNLEEAFSYELTHDPGSVFCYDNTSAILASAMLTKASGLKLRDYLLTRLFLPQGIPAPEWLEISDGFTNGATGLFLTTSEMAIFGQFLLQRGSWEGKQLVSPAWIDAATKMQVCVSRKADDYTLGYGYYFWIGEDGTYRCDGSGGHFIIVLPALDAVIAINSDEENMGGILKAVWDYLIPEISRV